MEVRAATDKMEVVYVSMMQLLVMTKRSDYPRYKSPISGAELHYIPFYAATQVKKGKYVAVHLNVFIDVDMLQCFYSHPKHCGPYWELSSPAL